MKNFIVMSSSSNNKKYSQHNFLDVNVRFSGKMTQTHAVSSLLPERSVTDHIVTIMKGLLV